MLLNRKWMLFSLSLFVIPLLGLPTELNAQEMGQEKKKKKEKPLDPKDLVDRGDKYPNMLDAQREAYKVVTGKFFDRVYGEENVPDDAKDIFRRYITQVMDGLHLPPKVASAELADQLMLLVGKRNLNINQASTILGETADVLGQEHLTIQSVSNYKLLIQKEIRKSNIAYEDQNMWIEKFVEYVKGAKTDEVRVHDFITRKEKERKMRIKEKEEALRREEEKKKKKSKKDKDDMGLGGI